MMSFTLYTTVRNLNLGPSNILRHQWLSKHIYYPAYKSRTRRRQYATQSNLVGDGLPSRKQVTVVNDDGRVEWKELSGREKAARTAQQSFNLLTILTGMVMTVRPRSKRSTALQTPFTYFIYPINRAELSPSSTLKSSPRIVRQDSSTGPLTE